MKGNESSNRSENHPYYNSVTDYIKTHLSTKKVALGVLTVGGLGTLCVYVYLGCPGLTKVSNFFQSALDCIKSSLSEDKFVLTNRKVTVGVAGGALLLSKVCLGSSEATPVNVEPTLPGTTEEAEPSEKETR